MLPLEGRVVIPRHLLVRQLGTEEASSEGGGPCEPLAVRGRTYQTRLLQKAELSQSVFSHSIILCIESHKIQQTTRTKKYSSKMIDIRLTYKNKLSSIELETTRKTNGV